jgi:hypothetical protein
MSNGESEEESTVTRLRSRTVAKLQPGPLYPRTKIKATTKMPSEPSSPGREPAPITSSVETELKLIIEKQQQQLDALMAMVATSRLTSEEGKGEEISSRKGKEKDTEAYRSVRKSTENSESDSEIDFKGGIKQSNIPMFYGKKGETEEWRKFHAAMEIHFALHTKQFKLDKVKILYIIMNFRDEAMETIQPYLVMKEDDKPIWMKEYRSLSSTWNKVIRIPTKAKLTFKGYGILLKRLGNRSWIIKEILN